MRLRLSWKHTQYIPRRAIRNGPQTTSHRDKNCKMTALTFRKRKCYAVAVRLKLNCRLPTHKPKSKLKWPFGEDFISCDALFDDIWKFILSFWFDRAHSATSKSTLGRCSSTWCECRILRMIRFNTFISLFSEANSVRSAISVCLRRQISFAFSNII